MINRQELLNDLKALLKRLETDLRERAEELGDAQEIYQKLTIEYEKALKAERTAATFEQWRAEQITQKAVAWILSCVFARFLEDNQLVDPPRIAGPNARLKRARDEHEIFFREHPTETDREYLLDGFSMLAKLPGGQEIFGRHNAIHVYPGWLSGDAAGELLSFFQTIDPATGELIHDFTDDQWDTRFLGDLYQDLSEAARKKYALHQTPDFVEKFILDRTLEPALDEFGLNAPPVKNDNGEEIAPAGIRMIDPACGSGHFLLGAFDRIFERWLKAEPAANSRDLAQRTLDSIYGVDLNPFAVAIARFRLLIKAMRTSGIDKLKNCPGFRLNLACGDSLLHGDRIEFQMMFHYEPVSHCYITEDYKELNKILKSGTYHAVAANPPYIQPKDKAANAAYRKAYVSAFSKFALTAPFIERLFELSISANFTDKLNAGFVGMIIGNSFMRQQFGRKLIEDVLPQIDLNSVVDTAGAYLPGHGTPTAIIFGRNRQPVSSNIRTVMGIKGEPHTPSDPSEGKVWSAIINSFDIPGTQNEYVSISDTERKQFHKHPWTISGGGASDLKQLIDRASGSLLCELATSIGIVCFTLCDEVFFLPAVTARRLNINNDYHRRLVVGEAIRDWSLKASSSIIFPYDQDFNPAPVNKSPELLRYLEPFKTTLSSTRMFGRKTKIEAGLRWFEYGRLTHHKLKNPLLITFSNIVTHNHFAFTDCGKTIYNSHAPVIKLPESSGEKQHFEILSILNSSAVCFWLKQVCHNKGSTVDDHGARQRTIPFEDFYEFTATALGKLKIVDNAPKRLAIKLHLLSEEKKKVEPNYLRNHQFDVKYYTQGLQQAKDQWDQLCQEQIYLQEEIDWQIYFLYNISKKQLSHSGEPFEIELGQRAFEIVMARRMATGELETTWFDRHGSTPITKIPSHWPEDYKQVVEKRIKAIEENPRTIGLIEQPQFKRRWNLEPWDNQLEKALKNWLLDRLESYFDFDGRMNDEGTIYAKMEISLTTVVRLADIARADVNFMKVAELYRKRPDFDVAALVADLVDSESVPLLPACRYKPTGMDKRAAWERTWRLQRIKDAISSLFDAQNLSVIEGEALPRGYKDEIVALVNRLKENLPHNINSKIKSLSPEEWLEKQALFALAFVKSAQTEGLDLDSGRIQNKLTDLAKDANNRLVGDIPVPPKYTTKDFQNTTFWRLRGKLDVPKERWVSFPHCQGEDKSMLIAWAGCDHFQMTQAIAAQFVDVQERTGGSGDPRLEILLGCIKEILPWVKQWHNGIDPEFHERMGDYFEDFIATEARQMGKTIEEIREWQPPNRVSKMRRR